MLYNVRYLIFLVLISSLITCADKLHEYKPKSTSPKFVCVDDQVEIIWDQMDNLKQKSLYLEIRKRDGKKETGKFMQISGDAIKLSRGFYYKSKQDSILKIDNVISIPKREILIMKIWKEIY